MIHEEVVAYLEKTPLAELLTAAAAARASAVGDAVHIRGLIEFSNFCRRNCLYCGLRRDNVHLHRYRMAPSDVIATAMRAAADGVDTIVLQSGEDPDYPAPAIARIVGRVKELTGLPVTLSVGDWPTRRYSAWRRAGADRYLIKHETADEELYARLHPGDSLEKRLNAQQRLRALGYAVGTGFIVGLPGQTLDTLARDILLVSRTRAEMCGAGPLLPQLDTPLGAASPGPVELTLKVMALVRLNAPWVHMPSTTALATRDPERGQLLGLAAGANVLMPVYTPDIYREDYRIYDNKRRVAPAEARAIIAAAGRTVARNSEDACRIPPAAFGCTSACTAAATSASRRS